MTYWIIIAIAFIAVAFCFSYRITKKHKIRDSSSEIFGLALALIWLSFLLGLYLSDCLKI